MARKGRSGSRDKKQQRERSTKEKSRDKSGKINQTLKDWMDLG
ncbi:MAG: hypothetical protein UU26_C0020G0006 [Candidatus Daviesbacteria bacterium GW2011_GWC1_40_9]|nr:MAG: hypothetical protein UU26_C0020G0006 [Candidatus Daviesbacteria bacterium GW2011_GWC1_40_9]